jgi:hypothetical protein
MRICRKSIVARLRENATGWVEKVAAPQSPIMEAGDDLVASPGLS